MRYFRGADIRRAVGELPGIPLVSPEVARMQTVYRLAAGYTVAKLPPKHHILEEHQNQCAPLYSAYNCLRAFHTFIHIFQP